MAFREVIEAVLKAKDVNRFKAGMEKGARAVRKFGRDSEEAAAQAEILERIEKRLERQTLELTAALELVANSVDEVGDEMVQMAAKSALANQVMKKSGSNAVFLGKSWAFWKDRLSLTRSELVTTALTIGTYFSPAIIAMGSSFAYAALGGGGVAFGGLSSLVLGLGTLAVVLKPVTEGVKKVMKAQDQYNLAVQQYGAASMQASRASAHMFGVIQTQGGQPVLDLVTNLRSFQKIWTDLTKPARRSLLDIMTGGLGAGKRLLPTVAGGANSIAAALKGALGGAFSTLGGGEFQGIISSLFDVFRRSIGPGVRGAVNLIMVLGRIAVAAGPWVVKWAEAWERTTGSWRRSTKDTTKLDRFFAGAITHFKAWWGLAKALGRTLKILFGLSKDEGLGFVRTLTRLVNQFNAWLLLMDDTGKVDQFWKTWKEGLDAAFFILLHPVQAFQRFFPQLLSLIDKYMPDVISHVATAFAHSAPVIAETFIKAFFQADGWGRAALIAAFMYKFGIFKALGRMAGDLFVGPFIRAFARAFLASMGVRFAEEGAIGAAMGNAGGRMGGIFGKAFMLASVGYIAVQLSDELDKLAQQYGLTFNKPGSKERAKYGKATGVLEPFIRSNIPGADWLYNTILDRPDSKGNKRKINRMRGGGIRGGIPGGALGGIIPPGGHAVIGERGAELATASPWGTQITPLGRNARHSLPGAIELPNLQNATHVTVYSYLQVEKREIAKAVSDQVAYDTARRGGHRRGNGN